MEKQEFLARLYGLECEIDQLKAAVKPTQQRNRLASACEKALRLLVSNWVLVTVLIAGVTTLVGIIHYDVNPFENFETIRAQREQAETAKKLSEFYREQGDKLLERQYYAVAYAAFHNAVAIDPNNIQATYGMAKAEVFIPADGQQYVAPGIVDAKLNKLLEVFPNDYQLYLFKGYQYQQKLDFSNAQAAFEHSVELNPKFVYGYLALGSNNQLHLKGDDESTHKTIEYYQKALELDPDNADAYNNLGYMYLFLGEFNPAYTNLNRANTLSPTFDTTLGLGDVYNYLGDSGNALRLHQWILYILSEPSMENDETFLSASLLYNYMPEQPGDTASISNYVTVNTMSDKRILLHYTLSYDYALTKKFDEADLEFGTAYQMDGSHQYNDFFRNKLTSLKNFLNPDQDVQGWLDTHIALLS